MNTTKAKSILSPEIRGELILLLTALIWGMSFVSQRLGMQSMGPFGFNALRCALGSLAIIPLILISAKRDRAGLHVKESLIGGLVCGAVLFAGASLQQAGIVSTSAGNAGFITGVYVILVPILGLFLRRRASWPIWLGACLALSGLYFLSIKSGFSMGRGDVLVLIGAFFWALHILVIGHWANRANALLLSSIQFMVCALLSLGLALPLEGLSLVAIQTTTLPLLYSGIVSIGIAFTLQIYGQKLAHPGRASIILSMESLFAALGGIFLLGESFTWRSILGSILILGGMIVAQIEVKKV